MKDQSLRVLMVDDSEDDVWLTIRQLKKGGFLPRHGRVDDAASMKSALAEKHWDIILCDYAMPHFDVVSALASLKQANLDIPLIIVSASSGDEIESQCMRLGAKDFVYKNNLTRLCPAIKRELEAAETRKKCEWLNNELQQAMHKLQNVHETIIQFMVSAIEARDPYKNGHQMRCANLACAIASEMGLNQEIIDGIRIAGSIHDIGKLTIPAELLAKPSRLTDIEFSLIKEHSQSGYEMLKDVRSSWPLARIVHQHHERMNGSGYPQKLKGEEILTEARILAVSDVVESMTSDRSYRSSLGLEVALQEIRENGGILYDKNVADVCLKLFCEKGYQFS